MMFFICSMISNFDTDIGDYEHTNFIKYSDSVWPINSLVRSAVNNIVLIFDLGFVPRWVEDRDVTDCAVSVWESIVKLIKYWLSLSQSKMPRVCVCQLN